MTSALPPVTIGISFYNAEDTLLDAVRSVFAQTHQNWELILIDDGSTDRSLEIARSIDDPRVRVYSDGDNKKLASRLNEIHALANHNYIARMDADDLMSPTRIQKQVEYLEANPDIDIVSTGVCSISIDSLPKGIRLRSDDGPLSAKKVLLGKHGIVHASVVARFSWYTRNKYHPEDSIAQDYKLWVRAFERSDLKVGFIDEPLYFYREERSVNAKKILRTYKDGVPFVFQKAAILVGPLYACYLVCRVCLKSAVVRFLSFLGGEFFLIRRRSSSIPNKCLTKIKNEIQSIVSNPVGRKI